MAYRPPSPAQLRPETVETYRSNLDSTAQSLEGTDSGFSRSDSSISQKSSAFTAKNRLPDLRPRPRRPRTLLEQPPDVHTEWMGMLLHQSTVIEKTPLYNILAAAATWLLLAGFIVLPGTYTQIAESDIVGAETFANLGLLVLASVLCGIGCLGVVGLWYKWRRNYSWLINRLFVPGLLNCLMGLISTLVNVLSKKNNAFNSTAIAALTVTSTLALVFSITLAYYKFHLLAAVKAAHKEAYISHSRREKFAAETGQVI